MSKAMQELREYTEGLQTSAQADAKAAAEQLAAATADLDKATADLTAERSKASNIQVALAWFAALMNRCNSLPSSESRGARSLPSR